MRKEITLSFHESDIKRLIEALLFSSTTDVCASWTKSDSKKMLDLAIWLKEASDIFANTDIKIDKHIIYITENAIYEDVENVKKIKKIFNI